MNRWVVIGWAIALGCVLAAAHPQVAWAHDAVPHSSAARELVGFDQRLDAQVPSDLVFHNAEGQRVEVGSLFGDKPVILTLSYFECEALCPLVRHGLVEALRPLTFVAGEEFDVVMVSIDPDESAAVAQAVKQETVAAYGRANSSDGWHFLSGEHDEIDRLAEAIGFRYAYDGGLDEYAHPSGIVVLTPKGRIARYFFGIEFVPQDLRLGLVEASQNRIGTAIDQLLLMCYHYDPSTGKYSLLIMNVLRLAAFITVVAVGTLIVVLRQRDSARPGSPFTGSFG